MDSTLPDAFEASQSGVGLGQKLAGFDSQGRILSDATPYIKVDGMFSIGRLDVGWKGSGLTASLDPPKFELESYVANYTGMSHLIL